MKSMAYIISVLWTANIKTYEIKTLNKNLVKRIKSRNEKLKKVLNLSADKFAIKKKWRRGY